MFGLANQIGGDDRGIGGLVGNHQDFRRPGEHVDADTAVENALGLGHILIAGPDQNVGRVAGEQAEGKRRNALHAAEIEDGVGAAQIERIEHGRTGCRRRGWAGEQATIIA